MPSFFSTAVVFFLLVFSFLCCACEHAREAERLIAAAEESERAGQLQVAANLRRTIKEENSLLFPGVLVPGKSPEKTMVCKGSDLLFLVGHVIDEQIFAEVIGTGVERPAAVELRHLIDERT